MLHADMDKDLQDVGADPADPLVARLVQQCWESL